MRVSIITINKNNVEGLRKTITSVINQIFDDFEYIIIDGNSSDGSVSIIKESLSKNISIPISWKSEDDSGIYNAMNNGITISKGDYLLFLNSGDVFVDNFLRYPTNPRKRVLLRYYLSYFVAFASFRS